MPSLETVFKAYDIRGTVPDELDAALSRAVGAAFARFTGASRVIVARDMRDSGRELSAAFIDGATSEGVDVADLGLCSTDLLYFASGRLDAPGAMFTASHNPSRYNGIKMCQPGARPIGRDSGLEDIKDMVGSILGAERAPSATVRPAGGAGRKTGHVEQLDMIDEYADHVRSFVDVGALRPLRVVADTANGMGGLVAPKVFDKLPFEFEVLYGELDGSFPNHPADPIQEANLADLRARVLSSQADVGLAFDGDADRVFLVDDKGGPMSGSLTTSMVAKAMLAKHPGATILYNLICSKAVPEIIVENGGTPVRTRVGHSFIKAVMAETGAVFGGEHSGHYYFRDNYCADSGLIASVVVLELLSAAHEPLSELRRPFERYADSGEVNVEVRDAGLVMESVAGHFSTASLDYTDGLTVDLGDWWFNLRPSNTEPLLRLNLEAATRPECARHLEEVLSVVRDSAGGPLAGTPPDAGSSGMSGLSEARPGRSAPAARTETAR